LLPRKEWSGPRKGGDEGEKQDQQSSQVSPIGKILEIESLQDYVLTFEKETKDGNMLKLIIEDRINRYDLRFINPQLDKNNNNILYAQGEKGMFATGAEVNLEILPAESLEKEENSIVRVYVFKKKKTVFKDDILISRRDTDRLRGYIREIFRNFINYTNGRTSFRLFRRRIKSFCIV
jgi:hypothetical protein